MAARTFFCPGIDFVLIDVPQFADDRIQLSRLVAAPRQVDQFPDLELGGGRCLQAAVYVVRVGNPVPGDKSGAINVGCGRRLETHEWDVDRGVDDAIRIRRGRHRRCQQLLASDDAAGRHQCQIPITILFSSSYLRTSNRLRFAQLSLWEDKGYSRKVTSARGRVKVTRVFSPFALKCFGSSRNP